LKETGEKIKAQFEFQLTLLDHLRSEMEFGLADESSPQFDTGAADRQAEFYRIEVWKREHFTPVQEIGHGIRSVTKLLLSLLDPVNQVILIDEPEMHVYPAQKRWLGRLLVQLGSQGGKQVFVVTHDPIILQGILDTPATTRLFRIDTGHQGKRSIRRCDLKNVVDIGAKRNQDSYLQGLFYQRFVGVEGAADRAFYQVITEEFFTARVEGKDLGFVACGGKGASKNMVYIAAQVGLRSAFIYDFDAILFDFKLLNQIVSLRGGAIERVQVLEALLKDRFGLDEKRIKAESDAAHSKGLGSRFATENKDVFNAAIQELKEAGVFIVPDGSLESWAPDVVPVVRFAEVAPDVIKKDSVLRAKIEAFVEPILGYLGC